MLVKNLVFRNPTSSKHRRACVLSLVKSSLHDSPRDQLDLFVNDMEPESRWEALMNHKVLLLLALALATPRPGTSADNARPSANSGQPKSDGISYVSAVGNDRYDGGSWGAPKATISGAYAALPSCRDDSGTYSHCGQIRIGAG